MVRKTTAEVKSSPKTSSTDTNKKQNTGQNLNDNIDITSLLQNARDGFKENWMTLVGFLLVLFSLIQLRELIFGIILLTSGILLISWFFSKK